ncbi:TetR/AcrR family transcriptional regulator [Streptomyces sp. NPDC048172]|uniref:TetR/AcrR family transcriptional regulator n=1 Tax=Streptomyces sp. NPDC048172 TaxID=3365505 RepID=UPI00371FBFF2
MAHISAAERRPQLVQAAIDLMAREGVEAGSTRAIAAELGVAQATVHYVFGSKQDLYRAVIEHMTGELVDRVRGAAHSDDTFERSIRRMAGALWEGMREQPRRSLLHTELSTYALRSPELREVLRDFQRRMEETAASLLTETAARSGRTPAEDPLVVARFFLAGLDGIEQRYLLMSDGTDESDAAATDDLDRLVTAVLRLAGVGGEE